MSTKVEAPPPRDIGKETQDTLSAQIAAAPQQFAAYQQFAPQYDQVDMQRLRTLLGAGDGASFLDLNNQLTQAAADQSAMANRLQREADIRDVQQLGGQASAAARAANPELYASLNRLDAMAGEGKSEIQKAMEQQALGDLAMGRGLSAEDTRNAQQAAARRAAARGINGNPALAAEVLNTGALADQRLRERRAFAGAVEGSGQNWANMMSGRAATAAQGRLSTYNDPFMAVLGRASVNQGTNAGIMGGAQSITAPNSGQVQGMFNPFNAYSADLYNTNYNGAAAAANASANNRGGLLGALIGAGGYLGGSYISRPRG